MEREQVREIIHSVYGTEKIGEFNKKLFAEIITDESGEKITPYWKCEESNQINESITVQAGFDQKTLCSVLMIINNPVFSHKIEDVIPRNRPSYFLIQKLEVLSGYYFENYPYPSKRENIFLLESQQESFSFEIICAELRKSGLDGFIDAVAAIFNKCYDYVHKKEIRSPAGQGVVMVDYWARKTYPAYCK